MKILFVAGSIEPGRDGVGDYVRRLAAECERCGHESFLIGLNDPWIDAEWRQGRIYRWPANQSWQDRAKKAEAFVKEVCPDIASLQLVPYSFHPLGLKFALPQILQRCLGATPLQVMFHELWIGANLGAPIKEQAIGLAQRKIVGDLIATLKPKAVHTSNSVYQELLERRGIHALLLPMFGSIPISDSVDEKNLQHNGDYLSLILFGAIHPEWSPDDLIGRLREIGRKFHFGHVGRSGPGGAIWNSLESKFPSQFHRYGERPSETVSRLILSADVGVATTPLSLIDKSSSIATILEHGLPVIVPRNDIHFHGIRAYSSWSDRLIRMDDQFPERLKALKKIPPRGRAAQIAVQFLADIGA
jgi:hypothetical protein